MPKKGVRKQVQRFPHEETWLKEFVGFHGTDQVTEYSKDDLGGVSLTRIVEAIVCGAVVWADKSDGPGVDCIVEHYADEGDCVRAFLHFVSNEEKLTISAAERIEESGHEPNRAA